MTVRELIEALKACPQDAEVAYFYDGDTRGGVDVVGVWQSGDVVLMDKTDHEQGPSSEWPGSGEWYAR